MHKELYIARGVMKTPGDTLSAETGLDAVNLMDVNGFALDPAGGWQPQIAGMKNGGVWADSNINTGRLLIAGADGNVTETIRLTITTGDALSLYVQITRLNRFIQDCREMWTTFHQIEPVFLWWWAVGAPGRQYALVFNIDMAVTYPDVEQGATADITLTLEREPYWRGQVKPGGNPKEWAYYARGEPIDSLSDWSLVSGTNEHFIYNASVPNRHEWTSLGVPLSANYIDIPGESIPGDAPALVALGYNWSANTVQTHIARTTKKLSYPERPSGTIQRFGALNAADAGLGTDTTIANDTGAVFPIGSGTRQRAEVSFGTIANTRRLEWSYTNQDFDLTNFSGRFAVFVRARQVNGALGNILLQIRAGTDTNNVIITLDQVVANLRGTSGNTSSWPIHYMGELTLPFSTRVNVGGDGIGVATGSLAAGSLQLWAQRLSGVGVVYINDVILMPFDEEYIKVITNSNNNNLRELVDSTGYVSHGETNPIAVGYDVSSGTNQRDASELQGNGLTLIPGVDNRLYFWGVNDVGAGELVSDPLMSFAVRLNIVPRWLGPRSV